MINFTIGTVFITILFLLYWGVYVANLYYHIGRILGAIVLTILAAFALYILGTEIVMFLNHAGLLT